MTPRSDRPTKAVRERSASYPEMENIDYDLTGCRGAGVQGCRGV
jgi:hypothetical protein